MTNIIVAFPKLDDAKSVKNPLVRNGFDVAAVCSTGAQAIHYADGLGSGIVISAYKLPDMLYSEIKEYIPNGFEMLLLANRNHLTECVDGDLVTLAMPFAVRDLTNTVNMMQQSIVRQKKRKRMQPAQRNEEEQQLIAAAKTLLIERNNLTEEEAHRYIQKSSMDSGKNL